MNIIRWSCICVVLFSCNGNRQTMQETNSPEPGATGNAAAETDARPGDTRPLIVYRTKSDLHERVPVTLSDEGTIVAYPHPRDLRGISGPPLPTDLGGGYLLDNRGIGPNTVYLSMDMLSYSQLEAPPSLAELEIMITDRDPFEEMYHCGPRSAYDDPAQEMKELVRNNALDQRCERIK